MAEGRARRRALSGIQATQPVHSQSEFYQRIPPSEGGEEGHRLNASNRWFQQNPVATPDHLRQLFKTIPWGVLAPHAAELSQALDARTLPLVLESLRSTNHDGSSDTPTMRAFADAIARRLKDEGRENA